MFEITSDVSDSIEFFQRLFQITVALALSESFKQFVADKPGVAWKIHVERLPALLIFICTIVPFFHGMNRYFYLTYLRDHTVLSDTYALQLLFDSASFLFESGCFFILSRALALDQLDSFLRCLIALLIVDSIWSMLASLPAEAKINFVVMNSAIVGMSFLSLDTLRNLEAGSTCADLRVRFGISFWMMSVSFFILVVGYVVSWRWYFPLTGTISSAQCTFWDICDILSRLRPSSTSAQP